MNYNKIFKSVKISDNYRFIPDWRNFMNPSITEETLDRAGLDFTVPGIKFEGKQFQTLSRGQQ